MAAKIPPVAVARPARQRRKEARPSEIVAAAFELFCERGYAATRLDDVAARAGISKGTLYLYFANKEALYDGVIRQAIVPAIERGEQRVRDYQGPVSVLLAETLSEWMSTLVETPLGRIPKLMAVDAGQFPELVQVFYDAVIARTRRLMRRIIALGVKRQEFQTQDIDMTAEVLLSALWMPAIARHSRGFHAGKPPNPRRYVATLVEMACRGLQAAPPATAERAR